MCDDDERRGGETGDGYDEERSARVGEPCEDEESGVECEGDNDGDDDAYDAVVQ